MTDSDSFAPDRQRAHGAQGTSQDLSGEISRFVEKQPGDFIRCTLVCNDNYRCNWWAAQSTKGYDNPGMTGLLVTTHRVRKSRFLHVTKSGDRLVIQEVGSKLHDGEA
jgi:hypothetical protein